MSTINDLRPGDKVYEYLELRDRGQDGACFVEYTVASIDRKWINFESGNPIREDFRLSRADYGPMRFPCEFCHDPAMIMYETLDAARAMERRRNAVVALQVAAKGLERALENDLPLDVEAMEQLTLTITTQLKKVK